MPGEINKLRKELSSKNEPALDDLEKKFSLCRYSALKKNSRVWFNKLLLKILFV